MTNAGLPVPPGFTISTEVCTIYYKEKGEDSRRRSIARSTSTSQKLEKAAGATLGSTDNPLLVSVRSGAKFSMPGMMDTILNLGLNDEAVEGLKRRTSNGRFAFDSYRRFIQMFGSVVLEIPKDAFEHEFDARQEGARREARHRSRRSGAARGRRRATRRSSRSATGRAFPQDPREQLKMARDAVFRSWMNPRAQRVPPHLRHPRSHRHRRQRPDDGVRQHRRSLRRPASASRATRRPARRSSTASS